jgi:phosphoglycolate phosphatase
MRALVGDGARALVSRALLARHAPFDEGALAQFVSDYTAHAAVATRPFPGVVATLEVMVERGWQFAVCTNKPEAAAHAVLRALGLDHWFAAIGGGDSFTTRKPDPAHLLSTLSAAKGEAGHAVMVGDHANDVLAAKGAGVACIFAAWGYGSADMALGAAATTDDVNALPALCEQLLPRAFSA